MKKLSTILFGLMCTVGAQALTLNIDIDGLRDQNGQFTSFSSLLVLVADVEGNGFSGPAINYGTTVNSLWGSDDQVIARFDDSVNEIDGLFSVALSSVSDSYGSLNFALYWFPTLTLSVNMITGGEAYGSSAGTTSWITPATGSENFTFLGLNSTGNLGSGPYTNSEMSANFVVSAVPEPATYAAFAGMAMLGLAVARRRKVRAA